jgi:glycosidase
MFGLFLAHTILATQAGSQPGPLSLSNLVLYEENIRAEGKKPSFKAVTARLGSIKALGTNVLWLMPVTPVGKIKSAGGLGSPYAFADFNAVNPEFGTADELKKLIGEAHRRKMAVIIDWVANHSAWDNPWITKHPDWYQHDKSGNIISPPKTNWNDVAQLDYGNHDVWAGMTTAMEGWVDKFDIDGFRCDSAEFVPDEFWQAAVAELRKHSRKPLLMLAEGYRPSLCQAGFDLSYGWHFADRLVQIVNGGSATGLAASVSEEADAMPPNSQRLRFLTNHDKYAWEGTPLEKFKNPGAIKVAFALTAVDGGVPLIYSGQEVDWPSRISIFEDTVVDWNSGADMRAWITNMLRVRAAFPSLRRGTVNDMSTKDLVILDRFVGNQEALVIANVRPTPIANNLPSVYNGEWTDAFTGASTQLGLSTRLDGYAVRILIRNK